MTNVMGSTNQRNMAADCKGDIVRRQGAWRLALGLGVWRLAFGPKGQENLAQALAWVNQNKRVQPCKGEEKEKASIGVYPQKSP